MAAISQSQPLPVISKCTIFPHKKSTLNDLKLSVSDLRLLSFHYIQKGCLFKTPPFPIPHLISLLKLSLSSTLTHFPPLAGRLITDSNGYIHITCNDAGADFIHADGSHIHVSDLSGLINDDVSEAAKGCFAFDHTVNYEGHFKPVLAVQVTELADGVFIGCSVNHAVTDGTSFWHFFNTFSELTRGVTTVSRSPDFSRDSVFISPVVLNFPAGGGRNITFSDEAPVRERIFRFSRESILKLKAIVNKHHNDTLIQSRQGNLNPTAEISSFQSTAKISSFQSLCALMWCVITRARNLPPHKTTTFRMAVNCRHRIEPNLDPLNFGNAIQHIVAEAPAGKILNEGLRWCAEQLNEKVMAHGNATVRKHIEDWERDPRCVSMRHLDGGMITVSGSPRFPMYENDFGWGRPVRVRSGRAIKCDGKISAFPSGEGSGGVELEVTLVRETMACLETDPEFMKYVSTY